MFAYSVVNTIIYKLLIDTSYKYIVYPIQPYCISGRLNSILTTLDFSPMQPRQVPLARYAVGGAEF